MTPRRIVIVGYPDVALLDVACLTDTFAAANTLGCSPRYELELASLGGRPISSSAGPVMAAQSRLERVGGRIDTMLVSGGHGCMAAAEDPRTVAEVRRVAGLSRRAGSVCTGAFVLAAAGLLDGRRATTHWFWAEDLAKLHPEVEVDPAPLFVQDGTLYTSAGVTSALDLALALVEADHGAELSRQIACALVTYLQRPANQAQVSMFVAAPPPDHDLVRKVSAHITAHLGGDLSAEALAAVAGLSVRQLARLFDDQLGTTPARHVRGARTEAAAQLLATTRLPLTAVARRCGFGSTETLREAFQHRYASTPSAYRRVHSRTNHGADLP